MLRLTTIPCKPLSECNVEYIVIFLARQVLMLKIAYIVSEKKCGRDFCKLFMHFLRD